MRTLDRVFVVGGRMRSPTLAKRLLALLAAIVLFGASGAAAWAITDDFIAREIMPSGASAGGVDLTGLTRSEAVDALVAGVAEPYAAPVRVSAGNRSFTLAAADFVEVDVDAMVEQAFAPKARAAFVQRVYDRLAGARSGTAVGPILTVDGSRLDAWIDSVAAAVDAPAVDATITVSDRELELTPSARGSQLSRDAAFDAVYAALTTASKETSVPVAVIEPAITEADLDTAILVRRSDRRLMLYDDGKLVKTYRVAVGAPSFPTPRGTWKIVQKRYLPTWGNPGSEWAKEMPQTIPPGPNNPLGTRALNLNASGIRIHGTSNDASIGTAASHGCMRMHRWDIEDLYERVAVGTPVIIID